MPGSSRTLRVAGGIWQHIKKLRRRRPPAKTDGCVVKRQHFYPPICLLLAPRPRPSCSGLVRRGRSSPGCWDDPSACMRRAQRAVAPGAAPGAARHLKGSGSQYVTRELCPCSRWDWDSAFVSIPRRVRRQRRTEARVAPPPSVVTPIGRSRRTPTSFKHWAVSERRGGTPWLRVASRLPDPRSRSLGIGRHQRGRSEEQGGP